MDGAEVQARRRNPRSSSSSNVISNVTETIERAEHNVAEAIETLKTLTWHQLEEWQKDNEYITRGYRRIQNSWEGCLHSVFGYLHNETVNIHSHLWGAVMFGSFLLLNEYVVLSKYPSTTLLDTFMVSIFLCAAVLCLSFSTLYHISGSHSHSVSTQCHVFDYSGIIIMIVGSFFPCLYYAFYCDSHLQTFYMSLIVLSGAGATYVVLSPEYGKPSHIGARTKVFIGLGLSAVIPISHALLKHGIREAREDMGVDWILASAALYIGGALLYANRIPERFSPGTFDYFFASHQIFHVCVVLAALAHYASVLTVIDHWHARHSGTCPAVS
ncbi:HlyIII-domain-containing protein [Schizopora paradoxa]|uniref:HlyIII-domain-containing protein n=1 Tax=Schizopora paradoxa TaxID=27342 RepID=A0A0H2S8Y8_9AGAM|nr:HlyIII-domain-containing protein [Schizopora paradoxa]